MVQYWRRLGLGARLTLIMVSLFLVAILSLTSLVFVQYKASQTQGVVTSLQSSAELNAEAFTEWLLVRQDEMRLLATLPSIQQLDLAFATELMLQLAQNSGFYDTIFVVGTDGIGQVGVSYADGVAKPLSTAEANNFNVADRAWFQQAIAGNNVFSQPVVSRATGQTVSTVAIPIRQQNQIVAVMRGAVQLETIFKKVNELSRNPYTEIYLLDTDGVAITPHQIATATEQQTIVSRDINQNFHLISDVAYQTNENVSQSAQASSALSALAEQLQELVRRFRL